MPRLSHFSRLMGALILAFILNGPMTGCKEKAPPQPKKPAKEVVPKLRLPTSQLQGITLNGRELDEVAVLAPESSTLDREDLSKAFGITDEKYLEEVMKLLQGQIQSGSPLNMISVFFGELPKKYAAQCAQELPGDFCLIVPYAFYCADAFPPNNWNPETYQQICRSLGRLKAYPPHLVVALFDGDNTLWYQDVSNAGVRKGVEAKRLVWDAAKAELLSIYPPPKQRSAYKSQKTPYDYYKELYKKVGPLWNYEYAALAFRGLPLKEVFINFQEMVLTSYAPEAFPEMTDLLKYLHSQGIVTGVVSASPVFGVIPTVERLGVGLPLERIEGLDVFIKNPKEPDSRPVRLSRLLNQGKTEAAMGQVTSFRTYQEFLEIYGDWIIVDVDHVINARGGKGVQSRSIARRHVADYNRSKTKPNEMISIDDMRLVLIGGDNFAPATDIANPEGDRKSAALEGGNDQGLSEGLPFMESYGDLPGGADFLFIRRYLLDDQNKVYPKAGKLKNFQEYIQQQKLIRPGEVGLVMIQEATTDVKAEAAKGGFIKERPTTPETQAMPETQPETQPLAAETQPSAETQPGVPLPPVPTPHPMPPGAKPPQAPSAPGTTQAPKTPPGLPPSPSRPAPAMTPPQRVGQPPGQAPSAPAPAPKPPSQLQPLPPPPSASDALP